MELLHYPDPEAAESAGDKPDSAMINSRMPGAEFGIGAYSLAEARRLLGVSPTTIRRWLFGYSYDRDGSRTEQKPLWRARYGADQDEPLLGFRDLLEARIVRGFRDLHIGLPTIRACLDSLGRSWRTITPSPRAASRAMAAGCSWNPGMAG